MPEITFILPHWIYWGTVLFVPLILMIASRHFPARDFSPDLSLITAYFFLIIGGFMGIHRLYLKSWGAAVFIILFISVIAFNHEARQTRNAHSIARNDMSIAQYDLTRAEEEEVAADELSALKQDLQTKTAAERLLATQLQDWKLNSYYVSIIILILLLLEAALMPRSIRLAKNRRKYTERAPPAIPPEHSETLTNGVFSRWISKINLMTGEFVAYWTVTAVFVFYYEVIARYIFNSPTIWAHESMYLLFGMQYMLAGGFCLREGAHVRVDVFYMRMSSRRKAIADLLTSVLFFIFAGSLTASGWIFFHDSFAIREVSFTEWAIPHWPIKFALPLGGMLIMLQGVARVLRDIEILRETGKKHGH